MNETIRFHPDSSAGSSAASHDRKPTRADTCIYLHVPFCKTRCHFCDFVIVAGRTIPAPIIERYLSALTREAEVFADDATLRGRAFCASQIGGGTPTYLSASQIETLLTLLGRFAGRDARHSTLVEGFPTSVSPEKLDVIATHPHVQLNLGVQSFQDALLATVGRRHEADDAVTALSAAKRAGIDSVGVDLIYGLPGSSVATARGDVASALDEGADHVTLYPLWVYPGTPLHRRIDRGFLTESTTKEKLRQLAVAEETLSAAGFRRYTAFHYARRDSDRHLYGLAQMRGTDWLGFGQGAVSQLGDRLYENEKSLDAYCARIEQGRPVSTATQMDSKATRARYLNYALRSGQADPTAYRHRFEATLAEDFGAELDQLHALRLVAESQGKVVLTQQGVVRIGQVESLLANGLSEGAPVRGGDCD